MPVSGFLTMSVCSSFTLCLRRICCVWSTLSTVFVANGTCCSLAGYDSDNSIVSVYCPPCLPCTTPVLPFTQSFSWESPASLLLKTTLITACALYVSWPVKFTYIFIQVFVKEGTLMKVSRKSRQPRHLFLVNAASTLHHARHINSTRWLLIVFIFVPSCNHGGVLRYPCVNCRVCLAFFCVQTGPLRAGFPGRMLLNADFLSRLFTDTTGKLNSSSLETLESMFTCKLLWL